MNFWYRIFSIVPIAIAATLASSAATAQTEFKLIASDAAAGDNFGKSVSTDGDYAIVGAYFDDDDGSNSGSAYIFVRSGTTWTEQAKLTASDAAASDYFGESVYIDGDYAIVGAYGNDDDGSKSGSAYIFARSGTTWTQQAKLTASDAAENDKFGYSVYIDGDYAIVGAHQNDDGGNNSGSAYIFVRSGTSWTEQAKLTASDAAASDYFGISVSTDGDYAIVGAYGNDDAGSSSGSAYIFARSGTSWTEQAKLTASDAASGDYFGARASISGDYAFVGAYLNDDDGASSGSAYIFVRSGTSWTEQAKLIASDAAAGDNFGISVSTDGDYAIVGAYFDDDAGSTSGSAYIFLRSGTTWTEQAKLTASDAAENDAFGYSVSIDGDYAIVGASGNDDDGNSSGSAYIYKIEPGISTSSFLTFGDVSLVDGIATVTDSITIKNMGTVTLTVNPQNNMGGGFTVSPTQLTVAPGDSVKLAVSLFDTTTGRKDASLLLDYNYASVGGQATIAVHANVYERVEGMVLAWGSQTDVPEGLIPVTAMAAGLANLALKSDGTVVAWGGSDFGLLDVPEGLTAVKTIAAGGGYQCLVLRSDGTVIGWGNNTWGQAEVPSDLTGVSTIAAGREHSVALKSNGEVIVWGNPNRFGQSQVPADLDEVIAIASGYHHILALKSNGTVAAWGYDENGEATPPEDLADVIAIDAGFYHSLALKSDGTVVAWGGNHFGQTDLPIDLTGVTAIAGGGYYSLALKSDGKVVSWGKNDEGQTNVPSGLPEIAAIAAGGTHSLVLTPLKLQTVTDMADTLSFTSDDGSKTKVKFDSGTVTGVSVGHLNHGRQRPAGADSTSAPTIPLTYFEINTTLEDSVTFEAMVSFQYTQALLDSASITDETTLKLFRYDSDDGIWMQVESAVDISTKTVSATTASFSVWSLASVTPTGVDSDNQNNSVPVAFSLATARPNPFNPSTTIAYEVPEQTHITLTVYNLLGQEVVRLVDQVQAAGRYEAVWNGNNITGAGVASGIYLYRITSGSGYSETKRMTLLK